MLLGCYSQAVTTKKERMPPFKLMKKKKKTQAYTLVYRMANLASTHDLEKMLIEIS